MSALNLKSGDLAKQVKAGRSCHIGIPSVYESKGIERVVPSSSNTKGWRSEPKVILCS